ncbi:MAG TPA: tetratricopeptide repeat protein [Gemmatimonadales bacterium]
MRAVPLFLVLAHAGLVMLMFRVPVPVAAPQAAAAVTPMVVVSADPRTDGVAPSVADLEVLSSREDSLMLAIQGHPGDTWAMQVLARLYIAHGWYEAAIRPLARAARLEPGRPDLWVDLGRAWQGAGRIGPPTDDDLSQAAEEFAQMAGAWGHGC